MSIQSQLAKLIPADLKYAFRYMFAVGGCVRDILLGREYDDIDLTGHYSGQEVVDVCREVGISAHIMTNTYGTVAIHIKDQVYEYTQFRREFNQDGRHTDWEAVDTLDEDLLRRDFTFNAMATDSVGHLFDPYGGAGDLLTNTIKTVGDPVQTFTDDTLRVIRMARFIADLDMHPTPATWRAAINHGLGEHMYNALRDKDEFLSPALNIERIVSEFKKAFRNDQPNLFLSIMYKVGAFSFVAPDNHFNLFARMYGINQNPHWHRDNVGGHTQRVVGDVQPVDGFDIADLRLAALFHDMGKVFTAVQVDGEDYFSFHNHEDYDFEYILRAFKLSNFQIDLITTVAENHMKVKYMNSNSKIRKFQADMVMPDGTNLLPALESVCRADTSYAAEFNEKPFIPVPPEAIKQVLTGKHLLARGITPGVEMGKRLKYAYQVQLDMGITDVEQLAGMAMGQCAFHTCDLLSPGCGVEDEDVHCEHKF